MDRVGVSIRKGRWTKTATKLTQKQGFRRRLTKLTFEDQWRMTTEMKPFFTMYVENMRGDHMIRTYIQPLFIHDINSKLQACGVVCKNYN